VVAAGDPGAGSRRNGVDARTQVVERGYERHVAEDEASTYTGGPTLA
jgi:hypothetical protein